MENRCFNFKCFVDSHQGDRKYMEDYVCTSRKPVSLPDAVSNHQNITNSESDLDYLAVFDGHGGPEAALFAQKHLHGEITKRLEFASNVDSTIISAIKDGFVGTSKMMWNALDSWSRTPAGRPSTAGTTASVVLLRGNKLFVAHVGDSTVVLGEKRSSSGDCVARTLTTDHKPDSDEELKRIVSSGGSVVKKAGVPRVVWQRTSLRHKGPLRRSTQLEHVPFLAVSRALGDLWSYNAQQDTYVVSPEPDVRVLEFNRSRHRFLILASDGLWNVVDPHLAVDLVDQHQKIGVTCNSDYASPATMLVDIALQRWSERRLPADNISVVVVFFEDSAADIAAETPLASNEMVEYKPRSAIHPSAHLFPASISDTPIGSNPLSTDRFAAASRLLKTALNKREKKKCIKAAHIGDLFWSKQSSVGSNRAKKGPCSGAVFQIPVTPEQRVAYWNRRGRERRIGSENACRSNETGKKSYLCSSLTPAAYTAVSCWSDSKDYLRQQNGDSSSKCGLVKSKSSSSINVSRKRLFHSTENCF